jgi:hypothetical protein
MASHDWTAITRTLSLILQELPVYFKGDVPEMRVIGNFIVLVFRNTSFFCPYHFSLFQL